MSQKSSFSWYRFFRRSIIVIGLIVLCILCVKFYNDSIPFRVITISLCCAAPVCLWMYCFFLKKEDEDLARRKFIAFFSWHGFLNPNFPFWLTLLLTVFINIAMFFIDFDALFQGKAISSNLFILIANTAFAIFTYFIAQAIQNLMVRVTFHESFENLLKKVTKLKPVLRGFAVELLKQFGTNSAFLYHMKDTTSDATPSFSIASLIADIQSSSGVKLSNYLYALLLNESLLQKPTALYAVWDLETVELEKEDIEYKFYTDSLKDAYDRIKDNNKKIRIFVTPNDDEDYAEKFEHSDAFKKLKAAHINWGFNEVYICSQTVFNDKKNSECIQGCCHDFVVFENEKTKDKWLIGKDRKEKKARIEIADSTESVKKIIDFFNDEGNFHLFRKLTLKEDSNMGQLILTNKQNDDSQNKNQKNTPRKKNNGRSRKPAKQDSTVSRDAVALRE